MKLLILTTQDRFFLTHVKERALYCLNQGFKVAVAVQCTDERLCNEIRALGFTLFDTKVERQSINPFVELSNFARLLRIYWSFKPDLVWHLGAKAIGYGTACAQILRLTKTVGIVNAPIGLGYVFASNDLKARCLRPILIFMYRLFLNPRHSKVIVENHDDIQSFIDWGALREEDAYCIPGAGVDTAVFCPSNNKNSVLTVMMASRLIKEKGVWDFVHAAEILHKQNIPVKMVLVGEPDYGNPSSITKEEYECIKNNPALECWGFREDMAEVLKSADVFCLPSFYREGLPRSLIEAASSGLAILTTDNIGCREVVRNGNGYLFKCKDVDALVACIEEFVKSAKKVEEFKKKSRELACEIFDSRIICQNSYNILDQLVGSSSK